MKRSSICCLPRNTWPSDDPSPCFVSEFRWQSSCRLSGKTSYYGSRLVFLQFDMFSAENRASKFVESEEQQKLRFQIELEFVQCLANPGYLNREYHVVDKHCISCCCCACRAFPSLVSDSWCCYCFSDLAQNGHFKNKSFINYINYLQYWKKPEYAKFLRLVL